MTMTMSISYIRNIVLNIVLYEEYKTNMRPVKDNCSFYCWLIFCSGFMHLLQTLTEMLKKNVRDKEVT